MEPPVTFDAAAIRCLEEASDLLVRQLAVADIGRIDLLDKANGRLDLLERRQAGGEDDRLAGLHKLADQRGAGQIARPDLVNRDVTVDPFDRRRVPD